MTEEEFENYIGVTVSEYSHEYLKRDIGNYHQFRLDLRHALGEYDIVKGKIFVGRAKRQMAKDAIEHLMPLRTDLENPDIAWLAVGGYGNDEFRQLSEYLLNLKDENIPSLMRLCAYTKYTKEDTRKTIDAFPQFLRYGKTEDRFKGALEREFDNRYIKVK